MLEMSMEYYEISYKSIPYKPRTMLRIIEHRNLYFQKIKNVDDDCDLLLISKALPTFI